VAAEGTGRLVEAEGGGGRRQHLVGWGGVGLRLPLQLLPSAALSFGSGDGGEC
jgi:hypothetical protein